MELLFRICLGIAGLINLLPSVLAFLPHKISDSYGIDVPNVNYELLLRHRAVLFGIVGLYMIYSALYSKYYDWAVGIGMVSMVSFVGLYYLVDGKVNSELTKVMTIDVVAIAILAIGYGLYKYQTI